MPGYREAAREHQASITLARMEANVAILGLAPTIEEAEPALAAVRHLSETYAAAHKWFIDEVQVRLNEIERIRGA